MRRTKHRAIVAAILATVSTSALSGGTLCRSSEDVVFSCQSREGKTVSVCAFSNRSNGAKLFYRYGSTTNLELELAADTSLESPSIEYNAVWGTRAYNYFIRFRAKSYSYTVQDQWDGCPWPGETHCKKNSSFTGVLIAKSDKVISRRTCTVPDVDFQRESLSRLGIPVSEKWPE